MGDRQGNTVTIESGIEPGARIVIQGLVAIRDGASVTEVARQAKASGEQVVL